MARNLGLSAKIQPRADKSSTKKMKRELEQELQDVEEMQFEGSGDFKGRTTPSGNGRGRGGSGGGFGSTFGAFSAGKMARGGGAKAAAGGAGGKLAGASAGGMAAGAAMLGTVALGGVLASKMYSAMSNASGRLDAANTLFSEAMKLMWRPFGDYIGQKLLPLTKSLMGFAADFNKIYQEKGLKVAITTMASRLRKKLTPDGDWIDIPSPSDFENWLSDFSWTDFIEDFYWVNYLNPLTWGVFIGDLAWDWFVTGMDWEDFLDVLSWGAWISGKMKWSNYIDRMNSDAMRSYIFKYAQIRSDEIMDDLFGGIDISAADFFKALGLPVPGRFQEDDSGGGGRSSRSTVRNRASNERANRQERNEGSSSGDSFDSGSATDTTQVTISMDGRRLSRETRRREDGVDARIV